MHHQHHAVRDKHSPSRSIQGDPGPKGLSQPSATATTHPVQRVKGIQRGEPVFVVDYGAYYPAQIVEVMEDHYIVRIASGVNIEPRDVHEKWVVRDELEAKKMVARSRDITRTSHIFGLDGKDAKALEIAIKNGYRIFDMAETYLVGLDVLMELISRYKIPRLEITIIYKIGHSRGSKDLYEAAMNGIKIAGGYIDILMLHESPGNDEMLHNNLAVLQKLKANGLILQGGISNITSFDLQSLDAVKGITVIQDFYTTKNAETIEQTGMSAEKILKQANPGEQITKMAYSILEGKEALHPDPGFLQKYSITKEQAISIWVRKKGYTPVNSSSSEETTQSNLAVTGASFSPVWDLEATQIGQALKGIPITTEKEAPGTSDPVIAKLAKVKLDKLYLAAKAGAETNDLANVLIEMAAVPGIVAQNVLAKLPLLWSENPEERNYKQRLVYVSDINPQKLNNFACNNKTICRVLVKTLAQYSTTILF